MSIQVTAFWVVQWAIHLPESYAGYPGSLPLDFLLGIYQQYQYHSVLQILQQTLSAFGSSITGSEGSSNYSIPQEMLLHLHLYSPLVAEGLLPGTIHSCQERESYHQAGSTFQHAYSAEFARVDAVLLALHPQVCLNSVPSFWTPQKEG